MESIQPGLQMVLDRGELLRSLRTFKRGDFSVRMPLNLTGIDGEIAEAFNDVVELEEAKAAEIARVAEQVGKEGQTGQRMNVPGASGGWAEVIESMNTLLADMAAQINEVARVVTSVAKGDLSHTMLLELDGRPLRGEALRLGTTVNTMVAQLNGFASEVSRVAREVGSEGKLGGQAKVPGVGGVWKDLTDNVNSMAANLTGQVRNIADVTTAVAKGDLSKKITVDVKGELLELKSTINTMVDQLNGFAGEVSRVAKEVGSEGKLGGQAQVKGVSGVWKDLTDNVNSMAANLTGQVRNIAEVTIAVAKGNLSRKITVDVKGELLELKLTVNTMVDQLNAFASEVSRVAKEVGSEGRLGGQAQVAGVGGVWKDLTDNVNSMAANLTGQVRNIAEVTTAVAKGDLSKKITVDVKGEMLELKSTVNTMVDQLNAFAGEVSRVAHEVGNEGKLGGQAQVKGVGGVWKDLTDNVNTMAGNLTSQVRDIAEVITAVANGDVSQEDHGRREGRAARAEEHHQPHGRPAQRLRRRGVARGEGSRHRRQARRPGAGGRRRRRVEGPDRQRELDGGQPHRPGAQHRRSDHRGRAGRPVEEDHGRREGRDAGAEVDRQHHGRPAQRLRRRGVARGEGGRQRGQARRPGAGDRRRRACGRI